MQIVVAVQAETDRRTADDGEKDQRALLAAVRLRLARLPIAAARQQIQQQKHERNDQQRGRYGRQYAKAL